MSQTWYGSEAPDEVRIGAGGWLLVALRGSALLAVIGIGVALILAVRAVERPLVGEARSASARVTSAACRTILAIVGLRLRVRGAPMPHPGAIVANHSSWLDIFALNACQRIYFVSKAEVSRWPVAGFIVRSAGTVFIERDRSQARAQTALFAERLAAGQKLLFFPEGTSTDGLRVLPFKSTLFQAFFNEGLRERTHLQAVSVVYRAPAGAPPRFYGWWGDMDFGGHLLKVLAQWRQGSVELIFHPPVPVALFEGRKALSAHLEAQVREAHPEAALAAPQSAG